jgi:peptide alpha-N-acetyltransferase
MADHDTTIAKDEASADSHNANATIPHDAAPSATENEASTALQPQDLKDTDLRYIQYEPSHEEHYLPLIRSLISKDLSEPYSIYVYRYFLYQWGDLCYMVRTLPRLPFPYTSSPKAFPLTALPLQALSPTNTLLGIIISKLEPHHSGTFRGYIAMLATQEAYRGRGIATQLVRLAIEAMTARDADEIVLETEVTNTASLKLYERLGFIRSKRLHRYYLNGNAAFRLILYLKEGTALKRPEYAGEMGGGMEDMRRVDEQAKYS